MFKVKMKYRLSNSNTDEIQMSLEKNPFVVLDERNSLVRELFVSDNWNVNTQQWEWATSGCSYNFINSKTSCPNKCRYCYVKAMNIRFKRDTCEKKNEKEETRETFSKDVTRIEKGWRDTTSVNGKRVYMIPSSHDIFEENVDDYCKIIKKCIKAGNCVQCVSKPRKNCVIKICEEMKNLKDKFRFRFTIGSMDMNIILLNHLFPLNRHHPRCICL